MRKKTVDKLKYFSGGTLAGIAIATFPLVFAHTDDIILDNSDFGNLTTNEVYPSFDEYIPYDGVDVNEPIPDSLKTIPLTAEIVCPTLDVISN